MWLGLISFAITSWARKTVSPRRRNGLLKRPRFHPESSRLWLKYGAANRPAPFTPTAETWLALPYATENMQNGGLPAGDAGPGKTRPPYVYHDRMGAMSGGEWLRHTWTFGHAIPVPRHSIYLNIAAANQGFQVHDLPKQIIPKTLIHEAINNPPLKWYGTTWCREKTEDQFVEYKYPADGCSEIHMIWTDTPSLMTCWNDSNFTAQAYRNPKIEFMLAQHPWFENDCHFADIVLPITTKFENEDIGIDNFTAEYGSIFLDKKCIEPRGESRSDYEAVCAVAEKLGLLEEYTQGKSVDDWIKFGFDACKSQGLEVSWEEFQEKGHYVIPNDPDWKNNEIGLRNFAEHPDEYPLSTPTGKLEFYSQRLADHFPDDEERPPVPHWVEGGPGWSHDERISGERAKKYPFLCLTNHPQMESALPAR